MSVELIARAERHSGHVAVVDADGPHSYLVLTETAARVAAALLVERADLEEARVAFMVAPGFNYVAVLWGIWRAGGIAVPLCVSHPVPELEYVLDDTGAEIVIADLSHHDKLRPLAEKRGARFVMVADALMGDESVRLPAVSEQRRALILYTSGTTNRPKGVVSTHANLRAQMESLVQAWGWTSDDVILHVLPLHHTHGIVNVLLCALWSGATCEFLGGFDAQITWHRFLAGGATLFMAVPTIYVKLIGVWQQSPEDRRLIMSGACRQFRLMVSGSAALPVSVFEQWRELSGQALLERYGMTEIGMALSNPLHGERRAGTVGQPLPGVAVRLVDEGGEVVTTENTPGEIQVRGDTVFKEYWGKPEATMESFAGDWFRTGDVAQVEDGYYRILGRSSVDIIKSGGYKISALEIEEALRTHPRVQDCAVVGLDDAELGEKIAAALVVTEPVESAELREFLAQQIAPYKVPRAWLTVPELPRNAMGKVTKPDVKTLFQ